jgi:hypothetical protein
VIYFTKRYSPNANGDNEYQRIVFVLRGDRLAMDVASTSWDRGIPSRPMNNRDHF